MAWTSPRTWSACEVVTAAIMNTHVRDNLNQTFPAIVTTLGDSIWATGANAGQRVAVGGNGRVIHANSACTAGVQWSSSAIFIDSVNDRVGIATNSPSAGLDITVGGDNTGASGTHIVLTRISNSGHRHWIRSNHLTGESNGGNSIEFFLNNSAAAGTSSCPGTGNAKVGGFYSTTASGGQLGIGLTGASVNANMNFGITLADTGAGEMVTLRDVNLGHGMNSITNTNTYGILSEIAGGGNQGGMAVKGLSGSGLSAAITITGYAGLTGSAKNNNVSGIISLIAACANGVTSQAAGSTANILTITNSGSCRFIFQGGGDLFADSGLSASAFDSFDDVQMVRALEVNRAPGSVVRDQFDSWLKYNRKDLQAADIAVFNDPAEGGDGSIFVNVMGLQRLHSGAIWQMHKYQRQLEDRITQLEQMLIGPPKDMGTA